MRSRFAVVATTITLLTGCLGPRTPRSAMSEGHVNGAIEETAATIDTETPRSISLDSVACPSSEIEISDEEDGADGQRSWGVACRGRKFRCYAGARVDMACLEEPWSGAPPADATPGASNENVSPSATASLVHVVLPARDISSTVSTARLCGGGEP